MGGNAFSNVKPIKKDHIDTTVNAIVTAFGIPSDYKLLGSAGKKPMSGDLDIAVSLLTKEKQTELFVFAKTLVNDHDVRKFGGNISFPWTVAETGDKVQVDFIFGDPEWLNFYYHSPGIDESCLKGTHRNTAISALASMTSREELSTDVNPDGMCVDCKRYKWSSKTGLSRIRRTYRFLPNGVYAKTAKEIELEGPYYNPSEVARLLFRGQLDDKYLTSAEKIIQAVGIVYAHDAETRDAIYQRIADNFSDHHDLKTKSWDYPAEIARYIR